MTGKLARQRPSLVPWTDAGPWGALRREMDGLVGRFFGDEFEAPYHEVSIGNLDVAETDRQVEVTVDLPGVNPDEIDVQIVNNALTISGERKEEYESEGENGRKYHRIERRVGQFSRTVMLPCPVDEHGVEAQFIDGVLTVTLPKTEAARAKKIPVKG